MIEVWFISLAEKSRDYTSALVQALLWQPSGILTFSQVIFCYTYT